ncbi:uncharacterized protein DSM5745_00055 [Aspergillus mulundensis]|uniref:Uncharacterized protein n=1 Tax=Aspergillus mulundensis TaxID=1810919 RepID=A0A3D8T2F6_9EURO|nr:Uncharacterized protein DSM5745_00055 [Aspergillus mulundensis]RDW92733.1 Uncharacterized protein DSM5745_00055 [Aspergillus mulundensis]
MSLITDNLTQALWEKAQAQPTNEWASANVWSQLWNKELFTGKDWGVAPGIPLEERGRRRVQFEIEHIGHDGELRVMGIAVHEAKAMETVPGCIQEVEDRAFDVCKRRLAEHPKVARVYAWTSFGTTGRIWYVERQSQYLVPMFGSESFADKSEYVELNSADAVLISRAAAEMKAVPPDV